jgi:hypothetical protein
MKASELYNSYSSLDIYVKQYRSDMPIKSFHMLRKIYDTKNISYNETKTLFKTYLPEVTYDNDVMLNMYNTYKFVDKYFVQHCKGVIKIEYLLDMGVYYNITMKDYLRLENILTDPDHIILNLYDIFKKHINDVKLYREQKLKRILNE